MSEHTYSGKLGDELSLLPALPAKEKVAFRWVHPETFLEHSVTLVSEGKKHNHALGRNAFSGQ